MAQGQRRVGEGASDVIKQQIPAACRDETEAVRFIEELRWGSEPACPRCGSLDVRQMQDRQGNRNARFLWRCHGCKRQFTVRIGTIFEDSRIPMRIWCHAFWRACASKKGVSALQISRETGLSYKSALFMMHRIRFAMAPSGRPRKLTGTVEADETFIGGKPRHRGQGYRRGGGATSKPPVWGAVERGGEVRTAALERISSRDLRGKVRWYVDRENTRFITDEERSYIDVGPEFRRGHETVKHSKREYVRGDVHTNTIESYWALLKRGITGTFHSVSKKHLHRYLSEFEFRYNQRNVEDGARTIAAIRSAEGKRLRYVEQISG